MKIVFIVSLNHALCFLLYLDSTINPVNTPVIVLLNAINDNREWQRILAIKQTITHLEVSREIFHRCTCMFRKKKKNNTDWRRRETYAAMKTWDDKNFCRKEICSLIRLCPISDSIFSCDKTYSYKKTAGIQMGNNFYCVCAPCELFEYIDFKQRNLSAIGSKNKFWKLLY